jgi:cytochrome c oxidase assembly protein subunit 15
MSGPSSRQGRSLPVEARLARITALATFVLLLAGGLVHATGSGLACPEAWFICHGSLFPRMVGGVLYEHGHRLIAMTVGLLTIATTVMIWRRRPHDRAARLASAGAIALVWLQGSLGAMTVKYKLPWYVSSAHLSVSMLFFSLVIWLAFRTRPVADGVPVPVEIPARIRTWLGLAVGATYAQIVLGALVRHHGAGLACNVRMPLCDGHFWPTWGPAQLHMVHRYMALAVTTVIIAATVMAMRAVRIGPQPEGAPARPFRRLAGLSHILVLTQIGLGVLSVVTYLGTLSVTAHLGTGAALLANLWSLYLLQSPSALPVALFSPATSTPALAAGARPLQTPAWQAEHP